MDNLTTIAPFVGNQTFRPPPLTPVDAIMVTLYGLICVVGLVGNGLVIFVILRYSKMKTVTNMYILNLSIAGECPHPTTNFTTFV